jgi:D-arabinose 1-dehydrogenase-like Zn-dependent alcohol dehydrogenase
MPLNDYLRLLKPHGHFVLVGAPESESLPSVSPFTLLMGK